MLNRRAFNMSLLLASAASALGTSAAARTTEPDEILLNRLTFGATPEARAHLARVGRAEWLTEQLGLPPEDPALTQRLQTLRLRIRHPAGKTKEGKPWPAADDLRPLTMLTAPAEERLPLVHWQTPVAQAARMRPAREVTAASLPRAVHAQAQVREVMTQFWHDHFNVHSEKSRITAAFFPDYDRALRAGALGNFRDLLGAVATSPAMLDYLDNTRSKASPANENFARELLELHTLGAENYVNTAHTSWRTVPGALDGRAEGYIDEDVYEVARAFTGWTLGAGRRFGPVELPATGRFAYVDAWHDPYQKRILGREFGSNRPPMADGEEVLDLLATHPGTARHICRKIARRLLSDAPSEALVDRLARAFLRHSDAPDQIARVIRVLVEDPDFAATPPNKLRRPFEFLAALYRATGAQVSSPEGAFYWQLAGAGWTQHNFPPPTGHPDRTEDWASSATLIRMLDMAMYAHDDWFDTTPDGMDRLTPDRVRTYGAMARHWAEQLHGTGADRMGDYLDAVDVRADDLLPTKADLRHHVASMALAFAAMSPRFLFR
ncbi:MAG: DUF1800 domain-containing protein [Pseudomonadota bacterium]